MVQPVPFAGGPVVIIGGGVIGLSIAHHLAAAGHRAVTVLERDLIGEGATGKATGGIRQQFSSPTNARICHRAVEIFENFEDVVGEPFAFRQHGYLFVTADATTWESAKAGAAMQQGLGIPTQVLTPGDVTSLLPQAAVGDLVGGVYCATDGSGSPSDLAQIFARQARRRGVAVRQHCPAVSIARRPDGSVLGVRTGDGDDVPAEVVIDAAGPWGAVVAAMAGVTVPIEPTPRQAFAVGNLPWISPGMPLTVDLDTGAYLHPERAGGIVGGTDRDRPSGFDARVDPARIETALAAITRRIPALGEAQLLRSWVGLREMTPDDHGMLGPVAAVPGLWLAAGFSGHGFMQSPVIGREVASWMLTGKHEIDLSALDPARFDAGASTPERLAF